MDVIAITFRGAPYYTGLHSNCTLHYLDHKTTVHTVCDISVLMATYSLLLIEGFAQKISEFLQILFLFGSQSSTRLKLLKPLKWNKWQSDTSLFCLAHTTDKDLKFYINSGSKCAGVLGKEEIPLENFCVKEWFLHAKCWILKKTVSLLGHFYFVFIYYNCHIIFVEEDGSHLLFETVGSTSVPSKTTHIHITMEHIWYSATLLIFTVFTKWGPHGTQTIGIIKRRNYYY